MRAREGDSHRKMSAMHRVWIGVIAAIGVTLTLQPAQPSRFDVLIRHARVMDGSGNPWLRADNVTAQVRRRGSKLLPFVI